MPIVCVPQAIPPKSNMADASSRQMHFISRQSVGKIIVARKDYIQNRHMPEFLSGTLTPP